MLEYLLCFVAFVLLERLCTWDDEPRTLWLGVFVGACVLCMLLSVALWFGILGTLAAFGIRVLLRAPRKGNVTR